MTERHGPAHGRIAAIVGPTASGKTALAVALRKAGCPIEAIGCDALQLYSGLDAATAKPDVAQRSALPYHLVDCCPPTDRVDAAIYQQMADSAIADVQGRQGWPLLVGGTGLYLRAVLRGLAEMPQVPAGLRTALARRWDEEGPQALHAELAQVDPAYAAKTPPTNRQRVLRALEVHAASGVSFSDWHARHDARLPRYHALVIVLEPPRELLRERIDQRAVTMVRPLLAECERLLAQGIDERHHATQAIGYREALHMVRTGDVDHGKLTELLQRAHRHYAKRQRTWFARQAATLRLTVGDPTTADVVASVATEFRSFFGTRA